MNRLAHGLSALGVGRGERVLWLAQGSARFLECLLAVAKLGAWCCPANWRQHADEMAFLLDDLAPRVVIWQEEEIGGEVRGARDRAAVEAHWVRHDPATLASAVMAHEDEYENLLTGDATDPDVHVDPSDPVLVVYTAAFAGRPNGALISHTACVLQGLVFGHLTGVSADDVFCNSGPLFHLGTLMHTLATFVFGGTNVFVRRVEGDEVCRVIERERCTGAFLVGPIFDRILAANADGRYDLSSLRTPRRSAEWDAMTSRDASAWAAAPGGYGQTEVTGMMTYTCLGLDAVGTHGRPSPLVQLRVVDPDGADVPVGEVGEIVARGPTVMNGYWNRPEENATRQRGGWHHTNDLGRREHDGSISFVGSAMRMIKSAAENIYPVEVERCLAAHPSVAECAVIGVPDPTWVQSVKAIVVLREGATATAEELIEHCRARMASYKKPKSIEFVDELPRSGAAIDYDALDARYGGGNYPGGRTRSA